MITARSEASTIRKADSSPHQLPEAVFAVDAPQATLQAAFNVVVLNGLRLVVLAVSAFHLFLALVYTVFLPPRVAPIVIASALGTAVILTALYVGMGRWHISPGWSHPLASLVAGLALLNAFLHLAISQEPRQTTIVVFIIIGVGYFFLSARWLALVLTSVLVTWAAIVSGWEMAASVYYYGFMLIIGAGLSGTVFIMRRQALRQYELLRWQDEQHKQELRHRARQLETSMSVGKQITSILDLDLLLQDVTELIRVQYGYYYVGIYLLGEAGDVLKMRAGTGAAGRQLSAQSFSLRVGEEGLVGWVAANGRYAYAPDVRKDGRFLPNPAVPHTLSELDLPLQMGNDLLGVLTLQSDQIDAFPAEDIPFLQSLADQVAIAIHNASSYQQEQIARYLAETMVRTGRALTSTLEWELVLEKVLAQLARIVSYDRGAVLVRSGDHLEIVAARGFPDESDPKTIRISLQNESIFKEIYRTQRPLAIPDVLEREDWQQMESLPLARAWLGVPLIRSDEVVGMLSLARETTDPFDEEKMTLATAFAAQAAIALENARLFNKTTRFNQQLEYEVQQRTRAIQQAYEQLEQLDRAKTDFISIASHELRTPLTVMRGYSQMLLSHQQVVAEETLQQLVGGIEDGVVRLEEVINNMLEVAKIENRTLKLYPEPVNLKELVEAVCQDLEPALQARNLTLRCEEMGDCPSVEADSEALEKVFYHLIVNAIKYTPDGGVIRISGRPIEGKNGSGADANESVELVVRDTGIGIDPDHHDLIFTKFFQTGQVSLHSSGKTIFKGGGPGLGLAISRGIIEAHGGKIWVESARHDEQNCPGSAFYVMLPLQQTFIEERVQSQKG